MSLSPFRPASACPRCGSCGPSRSGPLCAASAVYLGNQIDKLVIGGFAGAAAMGRYEIAVDVSSSPSQEINNPMLASCFPVMATAQHDRQKIARTLSDRAVLVGADLHLDLYRRRRRHQRHGGCGTGRQMGRGQTPDTLAGDCRTASAAPATASFAVFDTLNKPHISARIQWVSLVSGGGALILAGVLFHRPLCHRRHAISAGRHCNPDQCLRFMATRTRTAGVRILRSVFWRPTLASVTMAVAVLGIEWLVPAGGPVSGWAVCVIVGATGLWRERLWRFGR